MVVFLMRRRPPRSTRMTRSFPTRRSADLTRAGACQTRILETTVDARLIAIDALTGRPCRDFGRDGKVSLLEGLGPVARGYYFINGGPTIARGKTVGGAAVAANQKWGEPSGVTRRSKVPPEDPPWPNNV